jgi:hypothetical protein
MFGYLKRSFKSFVLPHGIAPRRILKGELAGFRMLIDLQEDTQVWRGVYEQSLQSWVSRNVQADAVCFDVGAAEGWSSLLMAKYSPNGTVYAFEPSSRGHGIEEVFCLNSDKPLASLRVIKAFVGKFEPNAQTVKVSQAIPTISLDFFCSVEKIERCDVIKIDVDGPEVDVLDGASATIKKFFPKLCVEIHSKQALVEVSDRLDAWGYECTVVDPPRHEHRPIEFNPMVFAVLRGCQ